jgi:transposase
MKTKEGKNTKRQFTTEFKLEAVRLSCTAGHTVSSVCKTLDVGSSVMAKWRRQYLPQVQGAFEVKGSLDPLVAENAELKRRLRVLEQEREILKKAAAYFAANLG